jgi:ABC-type amino acid transport substrate-binding protein
MLALHKWLATIFEDKEPRSFFDRFISIRDSRIGWLSRFLLAEIGFGFCLAASTVSAFAAEPRETETLRVAVYDVPPYGYVDTDGSISGVSVDLWRRVAEQMEWPFRLIPVSDMESILSGLEQGRFDVAIGVRGRQFARRPLLGRCDDDDRGLRRQDAKNSTWAHRRHRMDAQQPRIGFAVIDQSGFAVDGRTC